MNSKDEVIKKINNIDTMSNIEKSAYHLSADIASFLGDEIEELNVYSHAFRSGIEKCFLRVLLAMEKHTQSIVLFPESIPGFTMMVFKKDQSTKLENTKKAQKLEVQELKILDSVIGKFFEKNQQKVLLIENKDLIFAMFPVSDAKKHLKEMDLYITF